MNAFLEAALAYATQGTPIFPLVPRRKNPLTGHGFHDATTDLKKIEEWWTKNRDANIGSPVPPDELILDIEKPERIQDLINAGLIDASILANAPRTRTVGGGYHIRLKVPYEVRGIPKSSFKAMTGIPDVEIRGHGNYGVLPPSFVNEPEKGKVGSYIWEVPLDIGSRPAAPAALLEMLRKKPGRAPQAQGGPIPEGSRNRAAAGEYARLLQGVGEGERNTACTGLAGWLLARGIGRDEAAEILAAWNLRNRPPLPDDEIARCLDSISEADVRKRVLRHRTVDD